MVIFQNLTKITRKKIEKILERVLENKTDKLCRLENFCIKKVQSFNISFNRRIQEQKMMKKTRKKVSKIQNQRKNSKIQIN